MSDQVRRFLDVWIIETNTVYREVPFTVVVDWIQQGRLVEDDMLRPSGTAQWYKLGGMPQFAAYLPRSEPFRAQDQAEALEPVEVEFRWKRPVRDDDDDVDMIPLIDVSLVLLIFFMMISTAASAASFVQTPSTDFVSNAADRKFWVGINSDEHGEPTGYLVGSGDTKLAETKDWNEFVAALDQHLKAAGGPVDVTVLAHKNLDFDVEVSVLVELEKRHARISSKHLGVNARGGS
jgi:biopolymer transport protein ExbD